jgi:hypothetical protein
MLKWGFVLIAMLPVSDCTDHVAKLRALNVTPHVAQNDAITATGKQRFAEGSDEANS